MQSFPIAIGDPIDVEITAVDHTTRQIKVKLATGGPAQYRVPSNIVPGHRWRAVVKEKHYFGIVVTLLDSASDAGDKHIEATIPNSELSWLGKWSYYGDGTEFPLETGDVIDVVILRIDDVLRQVFASLKRATVDPRPPVLSRLAVGQRVAARLLSHQGNRWDAFIEPYEIRATISDRAVAGVGPRPRLPITATIRSFGRKSHIVVLADAAVRVPAEHDRE